MNDTKALLAAAGVIIVAAVTGAVMISPNPEQRAAAETKAATEKAEKAVNDAKCATDLQCLGDREGIKASFKCAPMIERLAENNFEWTDAWHESKLSRFRWKDREAKIITYVGDKIKFQNGFGAWIISKYECDFNTVLGTALEVRASPGRLPG